MEVLAIIIFVLGVGTLLGGPVFLGVRTAKKVRAAGGPRAALQAARMPWPRPERFPRRHRKQRISFVVPFRTDNAERARAWHWLSRYYKHYFPDAEFVVAGDQSMPFCKTAAVNKALRRTRGDVIVMMDADCFIEPYVILDAATRIREARERRERLWFIPYRRFYRLTEEYTEWFLHQSHKHPPFIGDPPRRHYYTPLTEGSESAGHWFGALIQIYPYEALSYVSGGMDERFRGWGGEDVSFMHALDTLYAKHKTLNEPVYHLWHKTIEGSWSGTRQWEGQAAPEQNDWLSGRYEAALGDKAKMARLTTAARDYARD